MELSAQQIILLLTCGIIGGFVSGSLGVGGAIIIVPFLVFFLGLNQHQAQGTSLMVLVFPVGIFAVMNYYKNGYVNFKFAFFLIIAFMLGSYLGSLVSMHLPDKILQKIFAVLLLLIGVKMLLGK